MKIATLNIQHRTGKTIVEELLEYLASLNADTLVLSEFKPSEKFDRYIDGLSAVGLKHHAVAGKVAVKNSVAIFSRYKFHSETFPELGADEGRVIKSSFDGFDLFGVYFPLQNAKRKVYDFFLENRHRPSHNDVFIMGDFNTGLHRIDESGATFFCSDRFARLSESGLIDSWRSRNPKSREFSWYSNAGNGFRLDHLFATESADRRIISIGYDHNPRLKRLTDHSALIAETR